MTTSFPTQENIRRTFAEQNNGYSSINTTEILKIARHVAKKFYAKGSNYRELFGECITVILLNARLIENAACPGAMARAIAKARLMRVVKWYQRSGREISGTQLTGTDPETGERETEDDYFDRKMFRRGLFSSNLYDIEIREVELMRLTEAALAAIALLSDEQQEIIAFSYGVLLCEELSDRRISKALKIDPRRVRRERLKALKILARAIGVRHRPSAKRTRRKPTRTEDFCINPEIADTYTFREAIETETPLWTPSDTDLSFV